MQLQHEENLLSHTWDEPTEEEHEEDMREDERCARWEAEAAARFVPPTMLARPFDRPRSVIVCIGRDVPEFAEKRIIQRLEQDLPGLMVHIDHVTDMGLCVDDLQHALAARCETVAFVRSNTWEIICLCAL